MRFTGFAQNHPTISYSTVATHANARYMSYWYYYFPKNYPNTNPVHPQKNTVMDGPMRDNDNVARKGAGSRLIMTDQGYCPITFWPPSITNYTTLYPYFHGKRNDKTKEGCNALYLDGHVQFVSRGEVESVASDPAYTDPSRTAFDWYWIALMAAYDRAAGG